MKANVDVLPLAMAGTAEVESLKKDRTYPCPVKGRGNLDATHPVCTMHTVVHSEAKNYIKCARHFLPKISMEVKTTGMSVVTSATSMAVPRKSKPAVATQKQTLGIVEVEK